MLDSLPDPGLPFHRFLEGNLDDVATLVGDLLASFGYPGFVPGYPPGWACNLGLLPLLPSQIFYAHSAPSVPFGMRQPDPVSNTAG